MLELGQPTHAFDADKLKGEIDVRLAREGEKFLALDGKTYSLTPQDLVIADEERAVGIGGVMGGEETGVTDSTKNVLLEAAYFLPSSVRRTARTLNLPSDASYRFERRVDPGDGPARFAARYGIDSRNGRRKSCAPTSPRPAALPEPPPDVSLRYERCDELLGVVRAYRARRSKSSKDSGWTKTQARRRNNFMANPQLSRRSSARSRSDRRSRAGLWHRTRALAGIAAVSLRAVDADRRL